MKTFEYEGEIYQIDFSGRQEIFNDELKFQAWKFEKEKKELKNEGGHKVIYEKGEILPK